MIIFSAECTLKCGTVVLVFLFKKRSTCVRHSNVLELRLDIVLTTLLLAVIALCPNNNEVHIYRMSEDKWERAHVLQKVILPQLNSRR